MRKFIVDLLVSWGRTWATTLSREQLTLTIRHSFIWFHVAIMCIYIYRYTQDSTFKLSCIADHFLIFDVALSIASRGGDLHILGDRYLGMLGADGAELRAFDVQNSGAK